MLNGTSRSFLNTNSCSICEKFSRDLLELACEHLKAERRLMELALNSRDAVATSAAALDVETVLQKRLTFVKLIDAHFQREHDKIASPTCDEQLTPSFLTRSV
jgi:tRNA(Ile)-lysidine synthase TilS/MesJ